MRKGVAYNVSQGRKDFHRLDQLRRLTFLDDHQKLIYHMCKIEKNISNLHFQTNILSSIDRGSKAKELGIFQRIRLRNLLCCLEIYLRFYQKYSVSFFTCV